MNKKEAESYVDSFFAQLGALAAKDQEKVRAVLKDRLGLAPDVVTERLARVSELATQLKGEIEDIHRDSSGTAEAVPDDEETLFDDDLGGHIHAGYRGDMRVD